MELVILIKPLMGKHCLCKRDWTILNCTDAVESRFYTQAHQKSLHVEPQYSCL